jgi:hypothetical protein
LLKERQTRQILIAAARRLPLLVEGCWYETIWPWSAGNMVQGNELQANELHDEGTREPGRMKWPYTPHHQHFPFPNTHATPGAAKKKSQKLSKNPESFASDLFRSHPRDRLFKPRFAEC